MLKKQQGRWLAAGLLSLAASLALDLLSKRWAWHELRGAPALELLPPTLEFDFAFNTGTAFSVVRVVDRPGLFLLMTVLVLLTTLVLGLRSPGMGGWRAAGMGVICGGALGNLHDRLLRIDELGRSGVVDFIKINYPWGGSWPTFNVADVALVVGALIMVLTLRERADLAPIGAEALPAEPDESV